MKRVSIKGLKTSKTACDLNYIETYTVKKECYLIRQNITISTFLIKLPLLSIG